MSFANFDDSDLHFCSQWTGGDPSMFARVVGPSALFPGTFKGRWYSSQGKATVEVIKERDEEKTTTEFDLLTMRATAVAKKKRKIMMKKVERIRRRMKDDWRGKESHTFNNMAGFAGADPTAFR